VYISFKINQNEIAKTICVLREQKNNTCNGNCVLRAELKKLGENEQNHSTVLKEKVESIYTITLIEYCLTPFEGIKIKKNDNCYKVEKTIASIFSIFHPPIS
jgi:hypothetical protein